MTREEAKRIAQGLITDFKCESETMVEFCNVIIESLEQEPCEDAISRQAVLDMMQMRMSGKELYKAVYDLPPVNPQPKIGWIPVSERLPEEAFGCLVTIFDTDLRTQDEFENILPYFVGYDDETWNDADGEPIPFEVIAWMPSPKPYKSESEDKE